MTFDPQPPPPESAKPSSGSNLGSLSQGEKLVGLGALIVIAVYVIWEVIQEEYFFEWFAVYFAVYILAVMWLKANRPQAVWSIPYTSQLRVVGYLVLLAGVFELITDLKFDTFDGGGATVAGALVFYGGCALAGFGAKNLD
jgi:hypothetical protein